ncbi:hypothetical protein SFRURICE_011021 [Spodoptera frugiperda]|nr:hypothetical protein SFRURICE_011021 [Spodoptera frugiperda]
MYEAKCHGGQGVKARNGGRRSLRDPRHPECLLRRLGREEDRSLTRSASSFASTTASHKEETVSHSPLAPHIWLLLTYYDFKYIDLEP